MQRNFLPGKKNPPQPRNQNKKSFNMRQAATVAAIARGLRAYDAARSRLEGLATIGIGTQKVTHAWDHFPVRRVRNLSFIIFPRLRSMVGLKALIKILRPLSAIFGRAVSYLDDGEAETEGRGHL